MAQHYEIAVCPRCHEQLDPEYSSYHEHDGIDYSAVTVEVSVSASAIIGLDTERVRQEREHAEAQAQAAARKAELEAMEAEWRASATPEQIAAYDAKIKRDKATSANIAAVMKEVWSDPFPREQMELSSKAMAAHITGDKARGRQFEIEMRTKERERYEAIIHRFEEEGPASVPFWKLRDARESLAEMA